MPNVQVQVKQGTLEGEQFETYKVFKGIPYAEAPVGDLRFMPPVEKKPWNGVFSAHEFGNQCPQADPTAGFYGKEFYTDPKFPLPKQSEDCLYLNVWTPVGEADETYPVAFWVHGGAFDHGFGNEMEFDGEAFAKKGVILVTINYRVGVFGFMADKELTEADPNHSTGNIGILDQISALKWVHENIEAFGGNPNKITVFGQSAGSMSVQTLISSPLTKGLIAGAIMQSASGYKNGLIRGRTIENAYQAGDAIKKICGVSTIAELRKVPAEKLVEILPELYKTLGGIFQAVVDNYVLVHDYDETIEKGNLPEIPYMIGCTSQDLFVQPGTEARGSEFYNGCIRFAQEEAKHSSKPTYVYYFKHQLPGDEAGAFHSSELWYTFGTLGRNWRPNTEEDYALSEEMVAAWTNFVKDGNPGGDWEPCTGENPFVKDLG